MKQILAMLSLAAAFFLSSCQGSMSKSYPKTQDGPRDTTTPAQTPKAQ